MSIQDKINKHLNEGTKAYQARQMKMLMKKYPSVDIKELKGIYNVAWEDGRSEGFNKGHAEGRELGRDEG